MVAILSAIFNHATNVPEWEYNTYKQVFCDDLCIKIAIIAVRFYSRFNVIKKSFWQSSITYILSPFK